MSKVEGRKRRRQSKKSKRSWRKHTDVQDVEEYLEDKQREEILGVPAAEKLDEQLFFVHNESATDEQSKTDNQSKDSVPIKPEKMTVRRRKRPLKTDMYLRPISAVEGFPVCKRRLIKKYKQRKASEMKKKKNRLDQETDNADGLDDDDSSSDNGEFDVNAAYAEIRRQHLAELDAWMKNNPPNPAHATVTRDLWAEEPVEVKEEDDEHYLRVTGKMPVKKPVTMEGQPSAIESVEVPHPGMSYNPTFGDHQELLHAAVSVEEERERAAQKLEKKLQLAELTHKQREQVWLEEMTEGILDNEKEIADDEVEADEQRSILTKRPVRDEDRKTKKQRRKEKQHKQEEQRRRLDKLRKSNMDEIYRLRSIKKEISAQEASISEKKKNREEEENNSVFTTKRLGKYVYEEPDLEVKLSSEIKGSLHSLKPEGNLAMDRFKSMQKRNMIEPRQVVKPSRKYKLKVKDKRSARLPEESQLKYEI